MRERIRFGVLAAAFGCLLASFVLAAPGPRTSIPREPAALARTLVETKTELGRAIDAWRAGGESRPPSEVTLDALYVDAVLRYAHEIRIDRRAFYEYYARQVFVRTASGLRRITGPGR